MKNKRGLEMGFAWIFAILVGGLILFLAIYSSGKYIVFSEKEINTKTAQSFLNVIDDIQTTSESGASDVLVLSVESRIYASCNSEGDFGESVVEFSERTGFGNKYSRVGGDVSTNNGYLFAEEEIEGKEINFLLFPFEMPFKIGDITVIYTDKYCFINSPETVEDKIKVLGANTISIVNRASDCETTMKKVCFNAIGCNLESGDIEVSCSGDCESGIVKKSDNQRGNIFSGNLLYGAIFSSSDNYECNTERLVKRLGHLSKIYSDKANFVSVKGCNTGLNADFALLNEAATNYRNLGDLPEINFIAEDIDEKNEVLECQLY